MKREPSLEILLNLSWFLARVASGLDYEQPLIFLRDSRVGEHASARENHGITPEPAQKKPQAPRVS